MKKLTVLLLFLFICGTNTFALENDVLYKYINLDTCISMGSTETYDNKGNEKGMVSVGFLGNLALGLQFDRTRYELSYQERAEVSEIIQALFGLTSTLTIRALMANVYYDYLRSKHFAMYAGAGIGVDYYKLTMKSWTDLYEDSGYSCILGAYTGLTFIINLVSIDLGINYYYVNKPETNSFAPKMSVRYNF